MLFRSHKFYHPGTDDPNAPKREDYVDSPITAPPEDFQIYPKQQTLERFQIRQNGCWVTIQVTNTAGNCDILSVSVDGFVTQEGLRRLA